MKTALIVFAVLIVALLIAFFFMAATSRDGKAPGLVEGRLAKCPDSPNCVCSEYKDDARHYVDPIVMRHNTASDVFRVLREAIHTRGGKIQSQSSHYLAASFSSSLFGFVDDVEIRMDDKRKLIHVRSASRVGHSDFGVNRQRIERLRAIYNSKTQ